MEVKVGDKIRIHYHPANPQRSFAEGVVSRVEVPTLRGLVFVIDVTYEVVLDRVLPIRPSYQNYVLYERIDEFPGRIEVLSAIEPAFEREPEGQHEAAPHERQVETEPATEQAEADEEPAPDRERGAGEHRAVRFAEGPKTALSRNSGPRLSYSSAPS